TIYLCRVHFERLFFRPQSPAQRAPARPDPVSRVRSAPCDSLDRVGRRGYRPCLSKGVHLVKGCSVLAVVALTGVSCVAILSMLWVFWAVVFCCVLDALRRTGTSLDQQERARDTRPDRRIQGTRPSPSKASRWIQKQGVLWSSMTTSSKSTVSLNGPPIL